MHLIVASCVASSEGLPIHDCSLLLVAHTVQEVGQDEVIRLISARRTTRKERSRYDETRA